jgi:hypothetical protein
MSPETVQELLAIVGKVPPQQRAELRSIACAIAEPHSIIVSPSPLSALPSLPAQTASSVVRATIHFPKEMFELPKGSKLVAIDGIPVANASREFLRDPDEEPRLPCMTILLKSVDNGTITSQQMKEIMQRALARRDAWREAQKKN